MKKQLITLILLAIVGTLPLQATQDIHVHGKGAVNIVLNKNKITIELKIPAMSLVGFEHTPTTKAEKKAIELAKKKLQKTQLFSFYKTNGVFKKRSNLNLAPSKKVVELHRDEKHHDDHDDHKKESHSDHDTHHNHHEKNHTEHQEHSKKNEHSEFHIVLEYTKSNDISIISTTLFEHFDAIHELNVNIISDNNQTNQVLNKHKNQVSL